MSVESLITQHIDIWTSAVQTKSTAGRGTSSKLDLYGIKKLRELILELAVRGKLVSQDPNDEPASVLLERIAKEKAKLVKDKKIKKAKNIPDVAEEDIPFKLPAGWSWGRVNELSKQVTDGVHHTPKYIDEGVPFISVKDLDGKTVSFDDCKYISHEQHTEINQRCNPELGDILLCRIGTLGRATVVDTSEPFSLFVSVGLLKFFNEYLISKYLHIVFHSPVLLKQYDEIKAGGSHTNKLNLGDIPKLLFPVAPLNEQHRIVAKVDELMKLCDQLEQQTEASIAAHQVLVETLLATLINSADAEELMENWKRISAHFDTLFTTEESIDQLKQTILQLAVMGKLVPQNPADEPASELLKRIAKEKAQLVKEGKIRKQKALPPITDDEKPFELPNGWEWSKFEHIAKNQVNALKAGPFGSALKKSMYVESGYKIYGQEQVISGDENFGNYFVDKEKYLSLESCKVQAGDILISLVGTIGKVLILSENALEGIINPRLVKISLFDEVCRPYIRIVLGSRLIQDELFENSHGSTMNVLNLGLLKKIVLPLPPVSEQWKIVNKVNELTLLCEKLKQRLRDSQQTQLQLTDAIIDQAI